MDVLETKTSNDSFCSSFLKDGSEADIKDEFVCELIRKQNDYEIKSKSEISSLNARVITHIYEKIDRKHNYIYDYKFREHLTSLGYDEQSCDQIISYLSDSYDGSLNLEETKAFFNLFTSPCWNFKLDMHLTRLLNCPLMPGFIDSFTDHQQVCHANYDHLWQKLHNFLLSHRLPAEAINEPYLENRIAVVNLRQRILYEIEKSYEELNSKNKTVCMDQECISLIKVCCSRERMNSLIDGSAHTYWQTSSDKCESHWIYISLKENVKLTSLSLHSIASKGDDTTLKSVLIEVRVGSNAAKSETVIAKCDYSLTNNTDYVICSCFPSDQDISYLKIVFKRPSEKNSFWGKLSDQIKVKWIHLVGKWVQPATTSKTSVQDAAICWYFEMMSSMSLIQSQLVPSLYPKILEITKSALKNIPPLSLANNSQNGVLSPSVLKKVDEFLKSFLEISQSNPENKPNAILTYLSFSLARGNLKTILDAINLILENSELSYEYSELIAQIDEASQLSLRKTAQSMNSKLIKLDENNSSATTTTNKPAATTTTTTTTGTINSTSNNEIDIVADSSNDETCEFSLEPYHQKMQESNKTAGCSSSSSLSSSSTSSPSNCCYNMLLAVESNMTVTNINLKLKLDSIGVKSVKIVVIIFNKNKPELEKFEEFDDFDQEKFDSYKEKTKKSSDSTERKEFEICYFDFFDNQIDIFLELPIYHLAKYILVKLIRPIEGNQTKPLTITKTRVLGCKHDGFELYDELKQLQNQSNSSKNSSYLLNSVLWFLCQLAQQHKNRHKNESSSNEKFLDFEQLEIANLWQVYEKSIEIGKKPDQERFTSLKIPSLILLYELVNCAEMKTSEMGKNEAVVAQRQNAKILENLCELIDGKSETSTNADDKKSPPPEETSLDRVLKTITKQIIKNGISVFFSSSNECRDYFLSMVDTNTGKSSSKSSSPSSSTTTTFKYETSLKKPSGKLLLEALCNLFCSSKSNMVQYLIGNSGNLFETSQSHRNLLDLVEKMIELSSNILDANNVYSGVELLLLDNRLVLSLIDLLNSIQSNIFFKLKTCLSKLYSLPESQVYENATRFVLDYAGLLIEKSRYLIEKNTSSSPSNSFLIDCFFTKLVYNFILWLSETLYLFKLSMASKFTKVFISFYELAKLLQKRAKIEESEKCLKTWTFDSKNKCSIFDLVINYSFPLATRFVIEFDPSSVLVFSESSTDAATYLFIDSSQKNHGFMGKLGSSNWKTTMEIKSNSSLVFSIRSNKDLKSSSLFHLKFTVRAYGYENASLQRVNVYEGELCEAVEATLGAHLSRLYAHRMRPHDFEFDENIKLLLTSDATTTATTKDRLLADHFDSDFYRVVVRGGRKETQSVDTNSPLTESPVDDDERLWRFLKKVARFLEDGYEPEPMVAKFVEMYDPQIKSFNKLGGRSFNDLLIRLVSSMLWLNPSIHFSDLFTIYDESLQTQTTTKPKLNSHVLAAFKFVESTRITVVRQQQQNNINLNLNNSTTTSISLIESMRKRADYLLGIDRLSESLLTYETLIRQRVEQQHPSSNQNYQHKINNLSDQQQTERKSPLIHHRMPLPKCASHPIYTLIFEFAFDCQLDLPLIDECLFLKRTNAALLCENFDLVRAHIEASFTNSIPENDRDEGLIRQQLEMVLILLSNFFSTWSRGRFNVVEANSHSANKSSSSVSTSKSFDSAILFPPTLKFKPNSYLQSLYGCGLDVEQRLRASYYGFLKGLINYSSKIRNQPNIDRLNSCLNCYILILLSIDWDINDLSYLSSSNLNVIDYLVDNCAHYMPITSEWSKVVVDVIRHKTPSDLLEDSFSLSRDRYNDAVNKGSSSSGSGGPTEKQQLAMLEEIDEEEEDEEEEARDENEPPERKKERREPSGGDREYVERPLFDSESFDLNLFPRMYHLVFGSGSGSRSSKFDTESLIKCLTFEIKSYEQYEKYIVARYMFWKYFSKLKTNFYCDSCSIILTSNRYVCLECRDHCFCTSCFVKSMISSATDLPASSNSSDQTTTALATKKKKPPQISFVNPSGIHRPSHRMLLLDHVCDQCNSLIIGKRIACRTCPDYDLCLSCHREIASHSIKPSKAHKSDHLVDIHEPIIVVAKPGDVTNTQVFLYLQSQMLYSTLALKSTLLHTTVRRVDDSQLVGLNMNQERSLIAGVYKQGFKCLLDMISASKSASLSSTNVNDRLGVFAFYNQETIIGLLACLVKLMHDDGGAEITELSSLSLVRFVLTMLKDNESFDNDVCIMLVNILGSLLVKCEPVECDRIAKEIFFDDEQSTKAEEEEKPLEEGEKKKSSSESSILKFIVNSIESFMQIDQITTVIAYLNLLFKLDASAGSKWRLQIANFLSSLLDQLLNYDASSLTPSSTASLLRTHSFLHALTFAADSSIFNGVWIEFKSESLYDGAGILRSNPDFKLGLTRIFYCDSCSQNPLTYFISLIEPETRKIINLKAQKFESHFRRVGGTESRLKLRSHFTLDPQHIVQIEKLIKRLVFSGGVVNSSVNYIVEGKRTGSSHSLRVTAKNSENSIPETTAATGGESQLTQPNLKQYEVVHVNKKRKFAAQFGQMRLSSNWLLNCLVNMLKNGFSDIILENEQDISKLEAACSDTDFLSIVYKLSFLSTQLNPYWKLRHLRKFLGNLYFFEENAIVSEFVEYEVETGSGGSTSGQTETETLSEHHHETETATATTTTKRWTKQHGLSAKGSSISISFKAGPNAAPATYYTCEDLKLTADKQTAILGICEASNSYMFKSHELSSFSDDQYNNRGGDQDYNRTRQSLALLENCTEKLTKFETASFNIPKSSTNVNPLARPTNSKSLNETIKSVMRLISNAVIVLSSREMLVQLIKICNSLSTLSSRQQQQIIQLPPGQINQAVQREYELLQLLDVLFHTDTLSTYKSIVVKTLLSAASSSENEENNNDVKLVMSRMACVHMLPEFKLVKRENWSSTSAADEKRGANDRGRIRRHRPLAALTSGLAENAVQFATSSTTAVSNQISTFTYSQAASAFKQSADSATDFVASTADAANGSKPGDIERLTSADSSNLLVVFDLNKTSVNANKNGSNLIAAFKRPNRQLTSRLLRQSKASLWLAKNNAAHRIIQQQEQSSNATSKQELVQYTDDFESSKTTNSESKSIQEALISSTSDSTTTSGLKPIPARSKKLLSKRAELGDENEAEDEVPEDDDKYDIDQEDDDMIMATTRTKKITPRYRFFSSCLRHIRPSPKAFETRAVRKCFINFQLVSKRKDPNDPRNMGEYGGDLTGDNDHDGMGDDDEDDEERDSSESDSENSSSSDDDDDEDDDRDPTISDVTPVDHDDDDDDDDEDDDDADTIDKHHAKNDKSSMDSYDETDEKEACFLGRGRGGFRSANQNYDAENNRYFTPLRGRNELDYKWSVGDYEDDDEYEENEKEEDRNDDEDEENGDEEMNTDNDAEELEWFEVDGESSAAAHATTNYHHGGRGGGHNDSDSDDNKHMRTNFRVSIDQLSDLPYLAFHNQRTFKWKFSRRSDNDWATSATPADTCSFKIYSSVSRNFESSYHILDELIDHMDLANNKQSPSQQSQHANNLWLHLIHAACVQTFTCRLKLLGLLVKMIKRVYYHHCDNDEGSSSSSDLDLTLSIDLFALRPLKSLHYTLETYYKLDRNLSRALYELFYFAEKLAIKFRVEKEFVARLRDKQELVKKFVETACIVGLISASINLSASTSPETSSNKHNNESKPTKKTIPMRSKIESSEEDDDEDKLTTKWCKKSSNLSKPSTSSWSPPSLDLKVDTAKKDGGDDEDDDEDDEEEEFFDGNENQHDNDGECEEIEDDEDDSDDDEINSKLGDL